MTPSDFTAKDRISLCMIVRNEADKLARALSSARDWVGEIVVVDTGSTDDTVAIAESFGAKVVHFAWCDDFSAARNVSLEAATREWALVLDADETVTVTDPVELTKAVTQTVIDGFSFRYDNVLDDGTLGKTMVFRLFRRTLAGMRYRGELHEQVVAVSERQVATAGLGCIVIRHDGHTMAAMSRGKLERNLHLARKLVASRPEDPFAWYALGLSLTHFDATELLGAYEKALSLVEATANRGAGEPFVVQMLSHMAMVYRQRQLAAKALVLLDRWIVVYPDSPDLRLARGELRLDAQDFAGARSDFEACLTPEAQAFYVILNPGAIGYAARTGFAIASLNLGRYDEAERALEAAVAEAPPSFTPASRTLGLMRAQRGAWAEAIAPLASALGFVPGDEEARFQLGWCFAKLERYDEAEETLAPLAARPDVQHLLGKLRLERGDAPAALVLLAGCPLPAADLARGWAHYVTGQPVEAADCWNAWLRAGAADWGTKDTLSMFLFLLQGGARPTGQPERPAEPLRDMTLWFRTLLRHERFEEVETVVTRGPELGERLWRPLRKMWGMTLAQEGYYDVALQLLLAAREAEPADPEPYYWLGYCSLHKQLPSDAKVLWEACLRVAPGHALAAQGLSLLR